MNAWDLVWRCTECGEYSKSPPANEGPRWRWNGEYLEHVCDPTQGPQERCYGRCVLKTDRDLIASILALRGAVKLLLEHVDRCVLCPVSREREVFLMAAIKTAMEALK